MKKTVKLGDFGNLFKKGELKNPPKGEKILWKGIVPMWSPEREKFYRYRDQQPFDDQDDMWAYGVTLLQLVTRNRRDIWEIVLELKKKDWDPEDIVEHLGKHVPKNSPLDRVIRGCINKRVAGNYYRDEVNDDSQVRLTASQVCDEFKRRRRRLARHLSRCEELGEAIPSLSDL